MDAADRDRFFEQLRSRSMLEKLLRSAARVCSRHGVGKHHAAARAYEDWDLLVASMLRVVDDKSERAWNEGVPFEAFMRRVMDSIASEPDRLVETSHRTIATPPDELVALLGLDQLSRDVMERWEQTCLVLALFDRNDDDTRKFLVTFCRRPQKRAQLAKELDWPLAKLDRVRARVLSVIRAQRPQR